MIDGELITKLIILGNGKVGKTSLCSSLRTNKINSNYDLTIGVDIQTYDLSVGSTSVKLVLWDLAGQQRFECIRPGFYHGSRVALVVFDLQNRGSFFDVKHWVRELKKNCPNTPFILVGNKDDVKKREVSKQEAETLARSLNAPYIETSALKGSNVDYVFQLATKMALQGTVVAG